MSDTPKTDAAYFKVGGTTLYDLAGEMKKLERELAAANERIRRLTEAGDVMALCLTGHEPFRSTCTSKWTKAKEATP